MQPEKIAHCAGCKREMYLLPDGDWCFSYYEKTDQECDGDRRTFLTTDETLPEADTFGPAVVCSQRCASDLAYNRASEAEKRTMRVLRDACFAILDQPRDPVEWRVPVPTQILIDAAEKWQKAFGYDSDNPPNWMNQEAREDRIDRAARHVAEKLEKDAEEYGRTAEAWIGYGKSHHAMGCAQVAAHCALMASELREALEEK